MSNSGPARKKYVSHRKAATERFASVMDGAKMTTVDPRKCFPLFLDRERYEGGVLKMMRMFVGEYGDGTTGGDKNVFAGSGVPISIRIT